MYRYIHSRKIARPAEKIFPHAEFDAVVSYSLHIGTEMALRVKAKKHIAVMHSSDPDYHREIIEGDLRAYDAVIAVSERVAEVYKKNYPALAQKITHIDNYVDGPRILKMAGEQPADLPEAGDRFLIATCGRLSHEKGFDLAVSAAERLKNAGLLFLWLFIGDGDERKALEEAIREKGLRDRIRILGFRENPYPYMAACDLYVQPSYEEAQPLVLLEAMLLGRPIVSTDTVGGRHILENGKKGVLTERSGDSIADAVLSLARDPERLRSFMPEGSVEENLRARARYVEAWDRALL